MDNNTFDIFIFGLKDPSTKKFVYIGVQKIGAWSSLRAVLKTHPTCVPYNLQELYGTTAYAGKKYVNAYMWEYGLEREVSISDDINVEPDIHRIEVPSSKIRGAYVPVKLRTGAQRTKRALAKFTATEEGPNRYVDKW